jgi:beta-glucanase (GH16 family)
MVAGTVTEKPITTPGENTTVKKKNGPDSKDKKAKKADVQQDCLIKGTPDLFQPLDRNEVGWEMSNWANGGVFNCTWSPSNVFFREGIMILDLTKGEPGGYPYVSGEYRTTSETYKYGYYETRMKAFKGAGLVAGTFFTYAGQWGADSHNEIDFEVLGKDPTSVQINYFYAGSGKRSENEAHIKLGFDATKDFHNYGFIWRKDSIEWYVDGKKVHKATANIPQDPCKIMVNFWPGTSEVSAWLGGVYEGDGGQVEYDWIKYMKLDE